MTEILKADYVARLNQRQRVFILDGAGGRYETPMPDGNYDYRGVIGRSLLVDYDGAMYWPRWQREDGVWVYGRERSQ